jgi:hypothetical protein
VTLALIAGAIVTLAVLAVLLGILIVGLAQTEDALRVWARRQRAGTQGPEGSSGKADGANGKGRA